MTTLKEYWLIKLYGTSQVVAELERVHDTLSNYVQDESALPVTSLRIHVNLSSEEERRGFRILFTEFCKLNDLTFVSGFDEREGFQGMFFVQVYPNG